MINFGSKAELYQDTKNVSARRPRVRVFLFSLAFFVDDWGFDWVALVVCGFILATHLLLARVALSYYADPHRRGSVLTFTSTAVIARSLSKMRKKHASSIIKSRCCCELINYYGSSSFIFIIR